jgi:sugar phosphate isomerase/epimerase
MNTDNVALQLYTVREPAEKDMIGTLKKVAEMGYKAVEFAGFGGVPASELRTALDGHGMRAISAHIPLQSWDSDPSGTLADLRTLGCEYALVPAVPAERRESEEDVLALAKDFDRFGEMSRSEGFTFAYHNHAFEFSSLNGRTMWDVLTEATDPNLVKLELDAYWVRYGGHDPVKLLRDNAGRVPLLHIKDMADDADRSDRPVGDGIMPWSDIFAAAREAGVEWSIVEQDNPNDPIEDSERSLRNVERM